MNDEHEQAAALARQLAPVARSLSELTDDHDWTVELSNAWCARLVSDQGASIFANRSTHDRWSFSAEWPKTKDGLTFHPPESRRIVRVSTSRKPGTLAKDIKRCLLDAYLADLPTYQQRADEHDRKRDRQIAIAKDLAERLGCPDRAKFHGCDCPQFVAHRHGVREVKVYSDETVTMELSSIAADVAMEVVELLTLRIAQ